MKYLALFIFMTNFYIPTDNGDNPFRSKKLYKEFTSNYPYVPSGTLNLEDSRMHVDHFFMCHHEVTNSEYREYLNATDQKIELVKEDMSTQKKETINYLYNPAFDDHPVRNVDLDQAKDYCKWLESILATKYEIAVDKIIVRLPTKEEWIYAARGGSDLAPYSWGGYYLRNAKGCPLANFNLSLGTGSITLNQETGEYELVDKMISQDNSPTNATSYFPNNYGLYNMCGNVAEMTSSEHLAMGGSYRSSGYDIRVVSEFKYDNKSEQVGFRPLIQIKS